MHEDMKIFSFNSHMRREFIDISRSVFRNHFSGVEVELSVWVDGHYNIANVCLQHKMNMNTVVNHCIYHECIQNYAELHFTC